MKALISIALASAWNRRITLGLALLAITLATSLMLSVERIRHHAQESFAQSVSGTDLIVGARGSALQLVLHVVFRIGDAANNIEWKSYQAIAADPAVAWAVPVSLGDSHRGFPVMGTTAAYFEHFRYGPRVPLEFAGGPSHPCLRPSSAPRWPPASDIVRATKLRYRMAPADCLGRSMPTNLSP